MNESASHESFLTRLRSYLWYSVLRVPWLIGYNVGAALVLVGFFAVTSQGQDMLRITVERGFGLADHGLLWNLLLFVGTLLASASFWYTSRLLLGRNYPGYPLPRPYASLGRRWWPRLAGVVVPLAIAWTLRDIGADGSGGAMFLSWAYVGMAVLLLAFYILRRRLFSVPKDYMIGDLLDALPERDRMRARVLLLAVFALLVLFMLLPVRLPQGLGAPAIIVLGVMGIALFGTAVLTYWPMSHNNPAATLSALLLAVLFGFWNHNHGVRVAGDAPFDVVRPTPAERLSSWAGTTGDARPLVFVTAAGGGIRAAYWTASVLAYLEEKLGARFTDHLFAISGVSGGSVGAAAYVTLKRSQLDAGNTGGLLAPVREVLGNDFLSPVVAGMLFPDLAQRFFPAPVDLADRQRFLERSFELAFDGHARELFRGPFQALYTDPAGGRIPTLLLNTTLVETGQRGILSNVQVAKLPGVVDLLDPRYQLTAIRTSAAAGASARFTYVSPAGRVDIADDAHLRLVDGGYFENSGAATMGDFIALLDEGEQAFRPVLMVINNDPTASSLCRRDGASDSSPDGDDFNAAVSDVVSPFKALLQTRGARQQIALVKSARLVESKGGSVIEVPLSAVLQVRIEAMKTSKAAAAEEVTAQDVQAIRSRYVEPPLGWSMSQEVRDGMDQTLDTEGGGLGTQFGYLDQVLGGGSIPPCEPM
jgi:hypothetical protein